MQCDTNKAGCRRQWLSDMAGVKEMPVLDVIDIGHIAWFGLKGTCHMSSGYDNNPHPCVMLQIRSNMKYIELK